MVSPNWGLLSGGNNALQMFDYGRKIGQGVRERQREDQYREAATVYANDPSEQNLNGLMPYAKPEQIMQFAQKRQEVAAAGQKQRRADLPLIINLVEQSRDEASYQQNRATAQQYGIDVSHLPAQFDPAWRDQQLMTLKALQDPAKAEALSTAGKQAVDMGYKPGTPEFNKVVQDIWTASQAKPYVVGGETRLYTPRIGGQGQVQGPATPPPAAIQELQANPGSAAQFDEIFGPGASARFLQQGGQTARPSGTFRGSFSGIPGETVTSTYRDPARNARVGGVRNSYHMRRTADGKPMARDSVPPPGMSMAAYAAQLRRMNPDLDVINEGDHVHMEPKG